MGVRDARQARGPDPAYGAQNDRGAQTIRIPPVYGPPASHCGLLPWADNTEAVAVPLARPDCAPTGVFPLNDLLHIRLGPLARTLQPRWKRLRSEASPSAGLLPYLAPYGYHAVNKARVKTHSGRNVA
jgi:hypothetical protein